jgi:hypothetical protein
MPRIYLAQKPVNKAVFLHRYYKTSYSVQYYIFADTCFLFRLNMLLFNFIFISMAVHQCPRNPVTCRLPHRPHSPHLVTHTHDHATSTHIRVHHTNHIHTCADTHHTHATLVHALPAVFYSPPPPPPRPRPGNTPRQRSPLFSTLGGRVGKSFRASPQSMFCIVIQPPRCPPLRSYPL